MVALGEKKRAPQKERREMFRIIIDDLLSKDPGRPGTAKLWGITKHIVEQYPCSFQDSVELMSLGQDMVYELKMQGGNQLSAHKRGQQRAKME